MKSAQFHLKINPAVLLWARESIGLSSDTAANKLSIEPGLLEKLEKGSKTPQFDLLLKMSRVYARPVAAFLLNEPPKEKPLPQDFRTVKSEETGHFHDKTLLVFRKARGLLHAALELRSEMEVQTPLFSLRATLNNDADDVAAHVRKEFQVSGVAPLPTAEEALAWLINRFEEKGIFVFQLSTSQDHIRGFSITDDAAPVIVIKKGDLTSAKIFTLFHELGHIILNQGGVCDMKETAESKKIEKWCNHLAGSVLVPLDNLKKHQIVVQQRRTGMTAWKKKDLVEIGGIFKVGPEVVLRRLLAAGYTTPGFYDAMHRKWNDQTPYSKNPPRPDPIKKSLQERGKNYTRLAFRAYESDKISRKDLSDYLDLKLEHLDKARERLAS
jgi:Zn-dependent peptidase ImmA (M78 family)/transcriptional regulator with XRE-family HTH domain